MGRFLWAAIALLFVVLATSKKHQQPHVVMVVIDDVGVKDLSYSAKLLPSLFKNAKYPPSDDCCSPEIPTPFIDSLADRGVKLARHYVHPTCTPTRASLMTGRYSANTGLPVAMLHGSVAGLPKDMETLPGLMKSGGYRTHMVGKWHLGHAQWSLTPVGRGFESHTGSFLWDLDSWSKEVHSFFPYRPTVVDWTTSYENRSYFNVADARHATEAITTGAQDRIREHAEEHKQKDGSFSSPLYLYVAYTAAHSPLLPMDRHVEKCQHIPHDWRRDYCGMIVGLDEALKNLTASIEKELGDNVVLMFTSDNGASPWFGGLSTPLRSGKTTPFEGGVRVPAFFVDFTKDHRYFGTPRVLEEMVHSADWLPTIVDLAGIKTSKQLEQMDGVSLYKNLHSSSSSSWPRDTAILDMHYGTEGESVFLHADIASIVQGKYKLIVGDIRDPHYYFEPTEDSLKNTDETMTTSVTQSVIRTLESYYGKGPFDSVRVMITHLLCHNRLETLDNVLLYDLEADPEEKNNLADDPSFKEKIKELEAEMLAFKKTRPPQRLYWHTEVMDDWIKTFKAGDCSGLDTLHGECRFTLPWLSDDVDTIALEKTLPTRIARGTQLKELLKDVIYHPTDYWLLWLLWLWAMVTGYFFWGCVLTFLAICYPY